MAAPDDGGDEFWAPERVERVLRAWDHLRPEDIALGSRSTPRVLQEYRRHKGYVDHTPAWQGAADLRCSLETKIRGLPVWLTQPVVVLAYVEQLTNERIAALLHCSRETVARERLLGIVMLARALGYQGDVAKWMRRGQRSPEVWRKEDEA